MKAVTAILMERMDQVLDLCGDVREGEPENHPQVEWDRIRSCSIPNKIDSLYLFPNKHLNQYESILAKSINVSSLKSISEENQRWPLRKRFNTPMQELLLSDRLRLSQIRAL